MLLSVCRSGLRVTIAYLLLGGGVPIPEQRLCWTLDSVPLIFKNHYIVLALGPRPMELVLRPAQLDPLDPRDASSPVPPAFPLVCLIWAPSPSPSTPVFCLHRFVFFLFCRFFHGCLPIDPRLLPPYPWDLCPRSSHCHLA